MHVKGPINKVFNEITTELTQLVVRQTISLLAQDTIFTQKMKLLPFPS